MRTAQPDCSFELHRGASGASALRLYSPADNDDGKGNKTSKVEAEPPRFVIKQALIQRGWEAFLVGVLTPFTAGLALLFLKPWLDFRSFQREARSIRLDGRTVTFTGELGEYMTLTLRDALLTIATIGIYAILGYPELNCARYFDEHLQWADDGALQLTSS